MLWFQLVHVPLTRAPSYSATMPSYHFHWILLCMERQDSIIWIGLQLVSPMAKNTMMVKEQKLTTCTCAVQQYQENCLLTQYEAYQTDSRGNRAITPNGSSANLWTCFQHDATLRTESSCATVLYATLSCFTYSPIIVCSRRSYTISLTYWSMTATSRHRLSLAELFSAMI